MTQTRKIPVYLLTGFLSSVVLPLPRNPVSRVTEIFPRIFPIGVID